MPLAQREQRSCGARSGGHGREQGRNQPAAPAPSSPCWAIVLFPPRLGIFYLGPGLSARQHSSPSFGCRPCWGRGYLMLQMVRDADVDVSPTGAIFRSVSRRADTGYELSGGAGDERQRHGNHPVPAPRHGRHLESGPARRGHVTPPPPPPPRRSRALPDARRATPRLSRDRPGHKRPSSVTWTSAPVT
ncbi:hypothetical protein Nmel_003529 [Mimus melanotis]